MFQRSVLKPYVTFTIHIKVTVFHKNTKGMIKKRNIKSVLSAYIPHFYLKDKCISWEIKGEENTWKRIEFFHSS